MHRTQSGNQETGNEINLSEHERLASVLGGSFITLVGLRRRSNFGVLLTLVGGGLIYRGVTGHCPGYAAAGKNTAENEAGGKPSEDKPKQQTRKTPREARAVAGQPTA